MVSSASTLVCFPVLSERFDLIRGTGRIRYFRSSTLAFHNLRLEEAQKRALDGRIGVEG
jgi:hypothetical protein